MPGRSLPRPRTARVTFTVPVAASTTGLMRKTRAVKRSSGNASTVNSAVWRSLSEDNSRSGIWIGHSRGSKSERRKSFVPTVNIWANLT